MDYYLYGDPESGRAWQTKFRKVLSNDLGAESNDVDPNLWKIENEVGRAVFVTHVDAGCTKLGL